MATLTKDDIIKALEGMKLTELNDLVKAIEEHFGVSAAIPVAAAGAGEAAAAGPSAYDVIVTDAGSSKVAVIKIISKITGKGLMDAKKMLEATPSVIKEKAKPEEAEDLKKQLVEAGASVELK